MITGFETPLGEIAIHIIILLDILQWSEASLHLEHLHLAQH